MVKLQNILILYQVPEIGIINVENLLRILRIEKYLIL